MSLNSKFKEGLPIDYKCQICGKDFGNNVKARDNLIIHLRLYGNQEMQEKKIRKEIRDIHPKKTKLHYEHNLRQIRGEQGEREEKEGREALARIFRHNEDPEELLNPNLEDISYPREGAAAAAAAAAPVIDPIDEQLLAFSTSAHTPGSHLKDFQSPSLGGRKSRSRSLKKTKSRSKSRSVKRRNRRTQRHRQR
jgi:hypothetical protein